MPSSVREKGTQIRFIQPPNAMTIAEALNAYGANPGESRKVQILRPFSVYSKNAYSSIVAPPIGPAYLAALLEKAGYRVGLIDAQGEGVTSVRTSACGRFKMQGLSVEEVVARIESDTSVLGVSLMFSQEWNLHRELVAEIKRAHPHLTIVAGGEHATAMPEYVLRTCPAIDFVVRGEGELTFLELANSLLSGKSAGEIPGIAFIDKDGTYVGNGLSKRIADVDNLPRPAWHLCNLDNYFTGNWTMGISYGRNMPILATRGCPYQCTFCSNPFMWTTRYEMRDPADVVDEIQFLINTYGANSIDFMDLTAIVRKDWILAFCAEMRRRSVKIVWQLPSGTRSEALDRETLETIRDAGCSFLVYAPESASQATLDMVKKRLKIERIIESIDQAIKARHRVKINLIMGFPREGRRSILQTFWFCLRMAAKGVNDCNIASFTPYPGSELYDQLRQEGRLSEPNEAFFDDLILQFDFTVLKSYCRNVGGLELGIYRVLGMGLFYLISYVFHPLRLISLAARFSKGQFQPQNAFEQRVYDRIVRARLRKKTLTA